MTLKSLRALLTLSDRTGSTMKMLDRIFLKKWIQILDEIEYTSL
jgi:hypothetical protein